MVVHTVAYEHEMNFKKNVLKIRKIIGDNKVVNEKNFFFFGELIFVEYILSKSNVESNKFSQTSKEMELI